MALIKDINSNVAVVDIQRVASRTSAGSYADGDRKNMTRKEGGFLAIIDVSAINTNVLIRFADSDTYGGTYATVDTGTAAAIPGPGSHPNLGTVSSASGVHTITAVGKYIVQVPATAYKQFMRAQWQTTGGACTFGITLVAVGPELPIAS